MSNIRLSEVLIKMTYKMPLLMAPRDEFVSLNIFSRKFSRKFSVDFPSREYWPPGCVDLFAQDQLIFFTDKSL
jgi:hypothetical protein